jgi:hypothetical protein
MLTLVCLNRLVIFLTFETIARNNNFPIKFITRMKTQVQNKTPTATARDINKKWATFTYHSLNDINQF